MESLPVPSRRPNAPKTPEALYDTLQGNDTQVRHLWSHQADALRIYYDEFRDAEDIALEFPTGAGKTLVGLLIAEWRRAKLRERVAFVCPTNQLANQAARKALGYGINVVLLIGSHREWDASDRAAFESGEAIAVTNYHHIFNLDPKLSPQTLVFDDAHAGEPAVAGRWSVRAHRDSDLYVALRDVVSDTLPGHFAGMIKEDGLDPRSRFDVELVSPPMVARLEDKLARALDRYVEEGSPASYAWSAVRPGLAACLMYVSWAEILLRPLISPTATLPQFADARHRVYMSATLGQAGELERSFGVPKIERIPLPQGWERQGSGRRLTLFPTLAGDPDFQTSIKEAMKLAGHSLVITPSEREAETAIRDFVPDWIPVIRKDAVKADFTAFTDQEQAVLVVANRYDGMDLPDQACRLVLLYGLPVGSHLQERFLFDTLGAKEALSERIRTRVTQGMGRATRNRQDFAAVLFAGTDLTSFLSREDIRAAMRPELQAELNLGLDYADQEVPSVAATKVFLEQGEGWRDVEAHLRQMADEVEPVLMPGTEALSAATPHEIRAWVHAWRGDFVGARHHARLAAEALMGTAVKQYRGLWRYLGASWAQIVAEDTDDPKDQRLAAELQREAKNEFSTLRWFPRFDTRIDPPATGPDYSWRAERAAEWLEINRRGPRLQRELKNLSARLASDDYKDFELGLEILGKALGFESLRPNREADPDCAWRVGTKLWILWEAKTMEGEGGEIPVRDVRQANSHYNWVARALGWPEPEQSVTVLVCMRHSLHRDAPAVANSDLVLASPAIIRDIGNRAAEALSVAAQEAPSLSSEQLPGRIAELFIEHRLSTETLLEELRATSVADGPPEAG